MWDKWQLGRIFSCCFFFAFLHSIVLWLFLVRLTDFIIFGYFPCIHSLERLHTLHSPQYRVHIESATCHLFFVCLDIFLFLCCPSIFVQGKKWNYIFMFCMYSWLYDIVSFFSFVSFLFFSVSCLVLFENSNKNKSQVVSHR